MFTVENSATNHYIMKITIYIGASFQRAYTGMLSHEYMKYNIF